MKPGNLFPRCPHFTHTDPFKKASFGLMISWTDVSAEILAGTVAERVLRKECSTLALSVTCVSAEGGLSADEQSFLALD